MCTLLKNPYPFSGEMCTVVLEEIHTHPMEGHQKFLGGGGLKSQNFGSKVMKLNWNFLGQGGQNKKPSMGELVWIYSGTTQSAQK